jgi:hypothetical protein
MKTRLRSPLTCFFRAGSESERIETSIFGCSLRYPFWALEAELVWAGRVQDVSLGAGAVITS